MKPSRLAFLSSYLPDLLAEFPDIASAPKQEFIRRVVALDFDDSLPASPAQQNVAINLKKGGLLSALNIHVDFAGQKHIYLVFSATGANALYEAMHCSL